MVDVREINYIRLEWVCGEYTLNGDKRYKKLMYCIGFQRSILWSIESIYTIGWDSL